MELYQHPNGYRAESIFVSESPLPSDYSQTTWTPITTWDVEQQKDTEGAMFLFTSIVMLETGTEEFAPEILGGV